MTPFIGHLAQLLGIFMGIPSIAVSLAGEHCSLRTAQVVVVGTGLQTAIANCGCLCGMCRCAAPTIAGHGVTRLAAAQG